MKLNKAIAVVLVSTSLLVACSSAPAMSTVDSPDSWVQADALAAVAETNATAVLGYESAGHASVSGVEVDLDQAGTPWELTEGHVTIVGYDEIQ